MPERSGSRSPLQAFPYGQRGCWCGQLPRTGKSPSLALHADRPEFHRPVRSVPMKVDTATLYLDLGFVMAAARNWGNLPIDPRDRQVSGELKALIESACIRLETAIKRKG